MLLQTCRRVAKTMIEESRERAFSWEACISWGATAEVYAEPGRAIPLRLLGAQGLGPQLVGKIQ